MKLHLKYKCILPSAIFLLLTYYIYSQYFAASFKHTSHQKSKKEPVAEATSYSKLSKINESIGSQGSDLMSIKSENNANTLKKISWYCESDAHLRELPIPTRMYNIPFHNLSLTLIAKVASTSWVAFLAQTSLSQCMVHLDKPSVGYASLHQCVKANLDTSSDNRRDNIRVVFVRDPWKRLVSVYKDKIVKQRFVQAASCYTRWNISRESNAESKNNPNLSFIQFLTCISEMGRNNPNWLDPHYRPQYLMHGPCSAGYTHIGKLEDLSNDFVYIMKSAQPSISDKKLAEYKNIFFGGPRRPWEVINDGEKSKKYQQYYADVSNDLMAQLQDIYKWDVMLYGYKLHPLTPVS
ncbi:hypothetical protein EB796_023512 [Bugula neritina]|uniref:Carbohydrate sulfotransferase n=1 Tax=Bugula neritina TaxID=10212 RepID=A0A7J7IW94_BUGNE|nr:hypothetical protein EB796_023512 [Bugula neritina]